MAKNRAILISIIDIIVVLGQRNIALRGNWDKELKKEDGNFQYLIDWKSSFDNALKEHPETASRSLQYLSPSVQNELVHCCEIEIREQLIDNCKKSTLFPVCADETTDVSVKEQLSICIRYVDGESYKIHEECLGYVEPGQVDTEHIAESILENLRSWGLDLENL